MNDHNYATNIITLESELDYLIYNQRHTGNVEILDIAVGTERGVGKGRRLVSILLEDVKSLPIPCHLVFALTRISNCIAQEFYISIGFHTLGVLYNFYRDTDENAIMFGVDLP